MSKSMIHTAISVRQLALHQIQSIPEEFFDKQPPQFSNTIRWNVGHIAFCLDYFLSLGLPYTSSLPESYATFFNTGTKPADWTWDLQARRSWSKLCRPSWRVYPRSPPTCLRKIWKPPLKWDRCASKRWVRYSTSHSSMKRCTSRPYPAC